MLLQLATLKFVARQVACGGGNKKATMLRDRLQGNVARVTWPLDSKQFQLDAFVYYFFKSDYEKLFPKLVLPLSLGYPNKPKQFIFFAVFGYPDETLALVCQ